LRERRQRFEDGEVHAFGDVVVDPERFTVTRGGRPVALEPKAFDLLILLIESQGRVVTKQEILDRVWGGTAVTDNSLTRIVAQLRKALGDDAREAKYIETVPTRGYRWRAATREAPGADARAALLLPDPGGHRHWPHRRSIALIGVLALVVGVALISARRRETSPRVTTSVLRPVQLTVSSGLDAFPAFSPDGRFIAFASNRTGSFEITVRGLAGGADDHDVTHDGGQNVQPAWSPDATLIAFHSRRRGGIWIVPALGGVARQVSSFGSRPTWSPDSRSIAFQSDPCVDISPAAYSANIPSAIWIVGRDGGAARALTQPGQPIGAHGSPVWSPDGHRIAFVSAAAGPLRLWTIPVEGGRASAVEGIEDVYDAAFTPDGGAIYATTGGPGLSRVEIAADGTARGPVTSIVTPGVDSGRHVAISADGRHIAFASLDLESHVWALAMAGGRTAGSPVQVTAERAKRQSEPAFSPDGRSLAFLSSRSGDGAEIWVVAAGGGQPTPVTPTELFSAPNNARPSWTRDGREVRYLTRRGTSLLAVSTALDSHRETTLVELSTIANGNAPIGVRELTVSPDGSMVAYSQIDPQTSRSRLYVRRIGGSTATPLTDGASSERVPVWSPDSRTIAFELKKDDATNVAIVPASGGAPRMLTASPGESWPYSWSPDGDKIVFAALRDGLWNLWWVSVATGASTQLTHDASSNTFLRYPAWSPAGDRIAFERGTVTGNIWIAQLSKAHGSE
jgi:Tol biopolymer transport system component/DNA-binding winged helix-turn-helix (wHTH) protein